MIDGLKKSGIICKYKSEIILFLSLEKASAPIGAREIIWESMTNRPTHQPTNKQTDMTVHRKVTLPIILAFISSPFAFIVKNIP